MGMNFSTPREAMLALSRGVCLYGWESAAQRLFDYEVSACYQDQERIYACQDRAGWHLYSVIGEVPDCRIRYLAGAFSDLDSVVRALTSARDGATTGGMEPCQN